ncbi:MAG: hypothetical protein KDC44_08390 [Phaeodactylibacter sp.]|nr:hypothetical protein [Phaeodactylibacter sp.]
MMRLATPTPVLLLFYCYATLSAQAQENRLILEESFHIDSDGYEELSQRWQYHYDDIQATTEILSSNRPNDEEMVQPNYKTIQYWSIDRERLLEEKGYQVNAQGVTTQQQYQINYFYTSDGHLIEKVDEKIGWSVLIDSFDTETSNQLISYRREFRPDSNRYVPDLKNLFSYNPGQKDKMVYWFNSEIQDYEEIGAST